MLTAVVDLEQVRMYRMSKNSRNMQSADPSFSANYVDENTFHLAKHNHEASLTAKSVYVDFSIALPDAIAKVDLPIRVHYYTAPEEIAYGPAQWCWDYLRRSGGNGFLLPLSGGADSSSSAAIIGSMCRMVVEECKAGNQSVINDVRRILGRDKTYIPKDARELCHGLFYTCYMGTENSSEDTRAFAERLSNQIGASHYSVTIDPMVNAVLTVFKTVAGKKVPQYHMNGSKYLAIMFCKYLDRFLY